MGSEISVPFLAGLAGSGSGSGSGISERSASRFALEATVRVPIIHPPNAAVLCRLFFISFVRRFGLFICVFVCLLRCEIDPSLPIYTIYTLYLPTFTTFI